MLRHHPTRLLLGCTISYVIMVTVTLWAAPPASDPDEGQALYGTHCARCHGVEGAGDGRDAARLYPRPRQLSLGVFKFRSTASGTPPTDEDLFRTLTNGLPGTRMPAWRNLNEEERRQLVRYVKHLAHDFNGTAPEPIQLPPEPPARQVDLAKGRQLFKALGCLACHGDQGRGNGASSQGLMDDWGQPIQAADLTQGWNYRGGCAPRDILMRLMTGIDGTPMPSYADAVSPENVWPLAYYVRSLQEAPRWGLQVDAVPMQTALPSSVTDPRWSVVPATDLRLGSGFYQDGAVAPGNILAVRVQAAYDAEAVALRLTWDDRTGNRQWPPDALAVLLPTADRPGTYGSALYWPATTRSVVAVPLDILYWSADTDKTVEYVDTDFNPAGPSVELSSASSYQDGRWTLVLRRPYHQEELAAAARPQNGHTIPMAVAAWDGGHQEQGRHRSASTWLQLTLGATDDATHQHAASKRK